MLLLLDCGAVSVALICLPACLLRRGCGQATHTLALRASSGTSSSLSLPSAAARAGQACGM